jgi:hypothetical protein
LTRIAVAEGARSGAALAVAAVVFAFLGLSPTMTWIPELLLIGAAIVVPVAILGWTGAHAASRAARTAAGALAGGLAGAVGGGVGGTAYVVYGKPALNILVGVVVGALIGAAIGFMGASLSKLGLR